MAVDPFVIKAADYGFTDNKDFYEDPEYANLRLHVPGLVTPLQVHREIVCVSGVIATIVNNNAINYPNNPNNANDVKVPFKNLETDSLLRAVFVKIIKLLYGFDEILTSDEVPAAASILIQLQLKKKDKRGIGANQLIEKMYKYMIDVAGENPVEGCGMLKQCVQDYPECFQFEGKKDFSTELAKVVFKLKHIELHYRTIVVEGLITLPPCYLDTVSYGKAHSRTSLFQIRLLYCVSHPELSNEDKRKIMEPCFSDNDKLDEISSREYDELSRAGFMDSTDIAEKERGALRLVETKYKILSLVSSSSVTTTMPTGQKQAVFGGAILDTKWKIIIAVYDADSGRSLLVTHLDTNKTEIKKNILPFDTLHHSPVKGDGSCSYYMESSDKGSKGAELCRIDHNNFTVTKLASLPGAPFATIMGGTFKNGKLYVADSDGKICVYDVAKDSWSRLSCSVPLHGSYGSIRLMSSPESKSSYLYAMCFSFDKVKGDGEGICQIDLQKKDVVIMEQREASLPLSSCTRDAILLEESGDDIIVVTAMDNGFNCYSSVMKVWTHLPHWKSVKEEGYNRNRNYLVYSPDERKFFYHVPGSRQWEAVEVPVMWNP